MSEMLLGMGGIMEHINTYDGSSKSSDQLFCNSLGLKATREWCAV
jgi:hypothetical protein